MNDVNNANRDDDDDDGYCVEVDDVGAGQLKKTGKRKREKKHIFGLLFGFKLGCLKYFGIVCIPRTVFCWDCLCTKDYILIV